MLKIPTKSPFNLEPYFTVMTTVRGHQVEYSIPKEFTVYIHGRHTCVVVDAVNDNGLAIRIQNHKGKLVRKYYAASTFLSLWKYRFPSKSTNFS